MDFVEPILRHRKLTRQELSWRMSDHCPLWVGFDLGGTPAGHRP